MHGNVSSTTFHAFHVRGGVQLLLVEVSAFKFISGLDGFFVSFGDSFFISISFLTYGSFESLEDLFSGIVKNPVGIRIGFWESLEDCYTI